MNSKETALAVVGSPNPSPDIYDRMQNPMEAVEKMGKWFAASGLFGVTKPEQGMILAMACMIERKNPLEIARTYHVIEGRLSKRADAMQAEFQHNGGRITWQTSTAAECKATFVHPEYCPKGVTVTVTMKELQASGVAQGRNGLKDNYRKFPRQMLRARVISEGVRMVDPSICAGAYTPEEGRDFAEVPDGPIEATAVETSAPTDEPQETRGEEAPPPPPPDDNGEKEHKQRCQRVLTDFAARFGLTQEDLEKESGVAMKDWGEEEFERATKIRSELLDADLDTRATLLKELFELEPGSMG